MAITVSSRWDSSVLTARRTAGAAAVCKENVNLVPGASLPLTSGRKALGASVLKNKGNNRILHIRFHCTVRSLHLWYLWHMPEMDAPRALVFRLLVKGNEALGTRLGKRTVKVRGTTRILLPFPIRVIALLSRNNRF